MSKLTPAASNRRLVRLLVPLAVASLTIAGCGDDDADDTASDTTEVAETTGETGGAGTDDKNLHLLGLGHGGLGRLED